MADLAKEISLIDRCIEVRSVLAEALDKAECVTSKLIGGGPDGLAGEQPRPVTESIQSILADVNRLAHRLNKTFLEHHEILGNFQPVGAAAPQRARA